MNTFSFRGVNLRALTIDGNPWFVAADVCRCLGLYLAKGTGKHLAKLRPDEKRWVTPKQVRGLRGTGGAAVTESGLYKLILRSDKPEAREFQDWVTREVLPSIRRTGGNDRHKK
jgi:prophage antirepressor-like protein